MHHIWRYGGVAIRPQYSMNHINTLIVNTNEPLEIRMRLMEDLGAVVMELGQDMGDFQLQTTGGKLLWIERKTPGDLVASIQDGRLFATSAVMGKGYGIRILLIDGRLQWSDDDYLQLRTGKDLFKSLPFASVEGALRRVQTNGCIVEESHKPLVEWLLHIAEWADDLEIPPVNRNPVILPDYWENLDKAAYNFLANLPGIGPVRAKAFMQWAGKRSIIEYLCLLSVPFGKDKPENWGDKTQSSLKSFLGLGKEDTLSVHKLPEWTEELDT